MIVPTGFMARTKRTAKATEWMKKQGTAAVFGFTSPIKKFKIPKIRPNHHNPKFGGKAPKSLCYSSPLNSTPSGFSTPKATETVCLTSTSEITKTPCFPTKVGFFIDDGPELMTITPPDSPIKSTDNIFETSFMTPLTAENDLQVLNQFVQPLVDQLEDIQTASLTSQLDITHDYTQDTQALQASIQSSTPVTDTVVESSSETILTVETVYEGTTFSKPSVKPKKKAVRKQPNPMKSPRNRVELTEEEAALAAIDIQNIRTRAKNINVAKKNIKISDTKVLGKNLRRMSKHVTFQIAKKAFFRIVIQISDAVASERFRWERDAVFALHEITEYYLAGLYCDANVVTKTSKRVTLMLRDIRVARYLSGTCKHLNSAWTDVTTGTSKTQSKRAQRVKKYKRISPQDDSDTEEERTPSPVH